MHEVCTLPLVMHQLSSLPAFPLIVCDPSEAPVLQIVMH